MSVQTATRQNTQATKTPRDLYPTRLGQPLDMPWLKRQEPVVKGRAEDGMPAMNAVSASIVLTDNHAFNGPMMLVPGSHRAFVPCLGETPDDHHKQSLKTQEFGVPSREALTELIERHGIEAPTGAAGGLLLFDCNTLHDSNANMSPDPRSNAFFVYNRRDNACREPYAAKRKRPDFLSHRPGEGWSAQRH